MSEASENSLPSPEVKGEADTAKFELTDANVVFLKHIQAGMKVKDAYKMAGYQSELPNVPYQFYWKLKKKLEALVEADTLDGLRLRLELSKIISLPLAGVSNSQGITVADKLKAIKTTHEIVEGRGKMDNKPSITAFIVHRHEAKPEPIQPAPIDVEELKPEAQ